MGDSCIFCSFNVHSEKFDNLSLYGHTISILNHTNATEFIQDEHSKQDNYIQEGNARKQQKSSTFSPYSSVSEPHYTLYALFGKSSWYAGSETNTMHIYDSKTKKWITEATPVPKRAYHSVVMRYDPESGSQELVIFGGMMSLTSKEKMEQVEISALQPQSTPPSSPRLSRTIGRETITGPSASIGLPFPRRSTLQSSTVTGSLRRSSLAINGSPQNSLLLKSSRRSSLVGTNQTHPSIPTQSLSPIPKDKEIYGDMWIYNIAQRCWFQVEYDESSLFPAPRYSHSASYSKKTDQMYILSGVLNMDAINEKFEDIDIDMGDNESREFLKKEAHKATLWTFNFKKNQWNRFIFPFWDISRVSIENLSRSNFAMFLRTDPSTKHETVVICLGEGMSSDEYIDTIYTFDTTTQNRWIRHFPSGTIPKHLTSAQYVYIEDDDTLVVYGGISRNHHSQPPENHILLLDLKKKVWTKRSVNFKSLSSEEMSKNNNSLHQIKFQSRAFGACCLLPRASRVHPQRFFVHHGLGPDRIVLNSDIIFDINNLSSVEKNRFIPCDTDICNAIQCIYKNRRNHYDVIFQLPFPRENLYAHSFILNQSSVLSSLVKSGSMMKDGTIVVDISEKQFSFEALECIIQMLYGLPVSFNRWEEISVLADVLKLPDILAYYHKKKEASASFLQSAQPKFNRAPQLRKHLSTQIPSAANNKHITRIKTLDASLLYFHTSFIQERCPSLLEHSSKISKLKRSIVEKLQQFMYGVNCGIDHLGDRKYIEHLLIIALAARFISLYELEEQALCHLKRHVSPQNASAIQSTIKQCIQDTEQFLIPSHKWTHKQAQSSTLGQSSVLSSTGTNPNHKPSRTNLEIPTQKSWHELFVLCQFSKKSNVDKPSNSFSISIPTCLL